MRLPPIVERVRGLLRRLFFWLPGSSSNEEMAGKTHTHDHALVLAVVSPERVPGFRQLRYASRVLSIGERQILSIAFLLALLSFGAAGATYAFTRVTRVPVPGGSYTEALVGQPKYINPIDAGSNDVDRDLVRLIFSGLFRLNGLDAVPDLASSYEWSADGKTLTVKIRSDARFHNGDPVTANDVLFTFDSLQNPDRKSQLAPLFKNVKTFLIDEETVSFELAAPDATFLTRLTVGILPSRLWGDIPAAGAQRSDLNTKPIGSGPYRVKSFSRDGLGNIHSYTLERVETYYGNKPFIKTLVFPFFADRLSALEALKAGQIDGFAFVGAKESMELASARKHDLQLELPQETIAFFNVKSKVFTSADVRRALVAGVFRDDIVRALEGGAEPVSGPFPFGAVSTTPPNVDRARELLTQAGWKLPADGTVRVWSPGNATTTSANASSTELAFTISVPDESDLLTVAEVLKRQWSLLGAKVTVEPMSLDELRRRATRERSTDVALINILLGPDQDVLPFWVSRQAVDRGLNLSGLTDRAVDDALDQIVKATSTEMLEIARGTLTSALDKTAPAAFLVRPIQHYLISSKIHLPENHLRIAYPAERFVDIDQWYAKTGWRWK
jgi:peptide/nickel transport system substrate-binding protein